MKNNNSGEHINTMYSFSKSEEKGIVAIISVMYVLIALLIRFVSAMDNPNGYFGLNVRGPEICGAIAQIPIMLCVWMTVSCRRYGFWASVALFIYQSITLIQSFVVRHNAGIFPGMLTITTGVVTCIVLHKYVAYIIKNEKTLNKIANTDELTQLPNRRALMSRLNQMTSSHKYFALVFIDLDNFKMINDTNGHDDGDIVLCEAAKRWQNLLHDGDYIARLGGDEFALIIENFSSREELMQHISEFCVVIKEKITIGKHSHVISASFGAVICPDDASNANQLLRYADMAMYSIKDRGKSSIAFFTADMAAVIESDTDVENKIRYALDNDTVFIVYQPQYCAETKSFRGLEALARIRDEKGSVIFPSVFIPIAERCGLIAQLENKIMHAALTSFKTVAEKRKGDFLLAVNLSSVHLQEDNFISEMWNIINETGFPAECLEVEITEAVLLNSVSQSIEKLKTLKNMGMKIALDDFGTGFASLNYLRMLPIDMIKIDKSFVDNIKANNDDAELIDAIIALGHTLHYTVVSEGVETESQLEILKTYKCDHIQGFVWGTPIELKAAQELVANII